MNNKLLTQAKRQLPKHFHYKFQDKNVLQISESEGELPFSFLIVESDFPHTILMSFAANFTDVQAVAHISIKLSRITHTELVEPFFIDPETGEVSWGEEAYDAQALTIDKQKEFLLNAEPLTDAKH